MTSDNAFDAEVWFRQSFPDPQSFHDWIEADSSFFDQLNLDVEARQDLLERSTYHAEQTWADLDPAWQQLARDRYERWQAQLGDSQASGDQHLDRDDFDLESWVELDDPPQVAAPEPHETPADLDDSGSFQNALEHQLMESLDTNQDAPESLGGGGNDDLADAAEWIDELLDEADAPREVDQPTPSPDTPAPPDRSALEESTPGSRAAERNTGGLDHTTIAGSQPLSEDGERIARHMQRLDGEDPDGPGLGGTAGDLLQPADLELPAEESSPGDAPAGSPSSPPPASPQGYEALDAAAAQIGGALTNDDDEDDGGTETGQFTDAYPGPPIPPPTSSGDEPGDRATSTAPVELVGEADPAAAASAWFTAEFPEGRGFGQWLDGTDFYERLHHGGEGDLSRETLVELATLDGLEFWSILTDEGRQVIRNLHEAPDRLYTAPGGIHELIDAPPDEVSRLAEEARGRWERARGADGAAGSEVALGGGGIHTLGLPISKTLIAIVAAAAAVAAVAVVALSGGGGDSEVPASSGGTTDGGAVSTAAAGAATVPGGAATVAANSCEAAHDQQNIVDLSSPGDVQPAIPQAYTQSFAIENGFPTPYLEWSELPPETTEIAILVLRLTASRGTEYTANPELWWTANPSGVVVWKVTGLDPSLVALPNSSATNPLPEGAVERMHGNGRLTLGDEVYEQKFWITSGEPHLFTVFALCDPPLAGTADDYNQPWLIQNAVGVGWFISSLEQ